MKKIATDKAPGAIGPYSQAVVSGSLVYTSGQIAMELVEQREEQGKWIPLSQEEIHVKPGSTVSKRVAVDN